MSVVFDFDFDSEVTLTVFTVYFCGVMGVVPGLLNFAKKLIPERPVPLRKRAEGIDIWGGIALSMLQRKEKVDGCFSPSDDKGVDSREL